jgi:DNA-binding NarL/FixJ family response regulator
MLAVLPLRPNAVCADAPALVVFGPRAHCKRLAIQFYAQAHRLSQAETAVLHALGEGLSPKEIADRNDVALSTVRTQVSSIRVKTGARSITELVLTLGHLPPIMPAVLSAL